MFSLTISFFTSDIPVIPKFSIRTFSIFGVTNAGSVGPSIMFFIFKCNRARSTKHAFFHTTRC